MGSDQHALRIELEVSGAGQELLVAAHNRKETFTIVDCKICLIARLTDGTLSMLSLRGLNFETTADIIYASSPLQRLTALDRFRFATLQHGQMRLEASGIDVSQIMAENLQPMTLRIRSDRGKIKSIGHRSIPKLTFAPLRVAEQVRQSLIIGLAAGALTLRLH